MSDRKEHPCLSCGACCACFRVAFHWREAEADNDDPNDNSTPVALTEDLDMDHRCMKGTNSKHKARCIALSGVIGKRALCSIYDYRPSPCRNFTASYESGYHNPRCDEARARHGLRPLVKSDYPEKERTPTHSVEVLQGNDIN